MEKKSVEAELYTYGLWAMFIGIPAAVLYFVILHPLSRDIKCLLYGATGLYCPGCGGTRAVAALLHGDLLLSVWYHPLVLYGVILFGGFMLSHTLARVSSGRIRGWRFRSGYLYGAIGIIGVNWILKNFLHIVVHIPL